MAKYQENIGENLKGELQILESKFEGSTFQAKIPREALRIWDPKLGIRGFQKLCLMINIYYQIVQNGQKL